MTLVPFLLADANVPFATAGAFLVLLLTLEIIGVLFTGLGVSGIGEMLQGDGHDVDVGGIAADALGYLHWGKVPLIVLLAGLTGLFALSGYGVQSLAQALLGGLLPGWLASIPALAAAVVGTHFVALPIARLMPSDSGDAVTDRDLLGLVGRVRLGPVRQGMPGEAVVRDLRGREHFVRIRTSSAEDVLHLNAEIVITGKSGAFYVARLAGAAIGEAVPSSLRNARADGAPPKASIHKQQEN